MKYTLVKITDTTGKSTGTVGTITYQGLTEKELDSLLQLESEYTYIGRDFQIEELGEVDVPSVQDDT